MTEDSQDLEEVKDTVGPDLGLSKHGFTTSANSEQITDMIKPPKKIVSFISQDFLDKPIK